MKTKTKKKVEKHALSRDLLAYEQNFIAGLKRAKLDLHLEACAVCRQELERVRRFLAKLQKALTPVEISSKELWARAQKQFAKMQPLVKKAAPPRRKRSAAKAARGPTRRSGR